jgi:hypothetical protein
MIVMVNIVSTLSSPLSEFMKSLPEHYIKNDDLQLGNKSWKDIEPKVRALASENNALLKQLKALTRYGPHLGQYATVKHRTNCPPLRRRQKSPRS